MIISNSHKFVFVHIHKTAGTSVTRALCPTARWNDIFCHGPRRGNVVESWYRKRYGLEKHARAASIKEVIGQDLWNRYATFSFVRNPYCRVVSLYTWLQSMLKRQSLRRYVRWFDKKNPVWQWDGMKAFLATSSFHEFIRNEYFISAPAAQPMYDWLSESGEIIVDFVGKVESMPEDFERIRDKLNLGCELALPRANVSKEAVNLADFYTGQADLDAIYDRYAIDFETFGYDRLKFSDL